MKNIFLSFVDSSWPPMYIQKCIPLLDRGRSNTILAEIAPPHIYVVEIVCDVEMGIWEFK